MEEAFHIISVKCFYLTAVTELDKLMSAPVFVVYYEISVQTKLVFFRLDQSYIVCVSEGCSRPRLHYARRQRRSM